MIKTVQIVKPTGVKIMPDRQEHNEGSDEITLEYFERWRKPCGKTERIYVRVTPETKAKLRSLVAQGTGGLIVTVGVTGTAIVLVVEAVLTIQLILMLTIVNNDRDTM